MSRVRTVAGYTLIEVMMGVALSAIGIIGITFMQTATVRSNQDAYESTIATNFARTWLERVKRDALLWTTLASPPPVATMFNGRGNPTSDYFNPSGLWSGPRPFVRAVTEAQESSGANYHGIEVGSPSDPLLPAGLGNTTVANRDIYYCLHLRFTTVQTDSLGQPAAMAVDARVYWARKGSAAVTQYDGMTPARANGCDSAGAVYNDAQMLAAMTCNGSLGPNYCLRVHYLRTVVRWVPPL
jgi:hypothetical protein